MIKILLTILKIVQVFILPNNPVKLQNMYSNICYEVFVNPKRMKTFSKISKGEKNSKKRSKSQKFLKIKKIKKLKKKEKIYKKKTARTKKTGDI